MFVDNNYEGISRLGRNLTQIGSESDKTATPSILAHGLVVDGFVVSSSEMQIDAWVNGDVHCAKCVVGVAGMVNGNIRSSQISILGKLNGNISAAHVHIGSAAAINGDINCRSISIDHGAYVSGFVRMTTSELTTPVVDMGHGAGCVQLDC